MAELPSRFGVILFPQFEVLDVFGPLEALNVVSRPEFPDYKHFSLSIIAASLDPVPSMRANNPFQQTVVPTHTLQNAPPLDVLLIPGGLGYDHEGSDKIAEFICHRYPSLKYLITVCTGADLAARAGVLDGRKATTNKRVWKTITSKPTSHKTHWIAQARWVTDGNVWTTSGVSAGTDGLLAWFAEVYGEDYVEKIVNGMEFFRQPDSSNDPFAKINGCEDVLPVPS